LQTDPAALRANRAGFSWLGKTVADDLRVDACATPGDQPLNILNRPAPLAGLPERLVVRRPQSQPNYVPVQNRPRKPKEKAERLET
jgi:hypothetical protein